MEKIDISYLFKKPDFIKAELKIMTPFPISVSNTPNYNFYMFEYSITKRMLSGMLENLLGLWFDDESQLNIIKNIKKVYPQFETIKTKRKYIGGDYTPITSHLYDIIDVIYPQKKEYFVDTQLVLRSRLNDGYSHYNGSKHKDISIEQYYSGRKLNLFDSDDELLNAALKQLEDKKINSKLKPSNKPKKGKSNKPVDEITNDIISELMKDDNFKGSLPKYYSSIVKREYLIIDNITINLDIDETFFNVLLENLDKNMIHLGTSDGIVYLKLNKI